MAGQPQGKVQFSPQTLSQADLYLENCRLLNVSVFYPASRAHVLCLQVEVDPAILVSLETRWYFMETSRKTSYGCTLPLLGVLDSNDHVTHFRLNTVPEQVVRRCCSVVSVVLMLLRATSMSEC